MKISVLDQEAFAKVLVRLQRRARKLKVPVPEFTVLGERAEVRTCYTLDENGKREEVGSESVVVYDIEITNAEPIKFNGWEFAARVEHTKGGNLTYARPEISIPARYADAGCVCEHCNAQRNRSRLYIVRNPETDTWKQVGSTCLADFMGGESAAVIAAQFEFLGDLYHNLSAYCDSERDGFEGGGMRRTKAYDLITVLSMAIRATHQFGWMSKGKVWEAQQAGDNSKTATAGRVADNLNPYWVSDARKKFPELLIDDTTPEDSDQAEEAIAYFASLPVSEVENDLTRNLRIIANCGYCSPKSMGLAAAMRICYEVAQRRLAGEELAAQERASSQHVGEVGKRQTFVGTVRNIFYRDTDFGMMTTTILRDDAGNVLVAKALVAEAMDMSDLMNPVKGYFDVQRGDKVQFLATVKAHGDYKGTKQTELLRAAKCRMVEPA